VVVEKTRAWKYGDPMDKANDMGTVIDEPAAMLFESRVNEAVAQGARLLVGNQRHGALYSPHGARPGAIRDDRGAEETFGPVSPIIRFKPIDEAIRISQRHGLWPVLGGVHQPAGLHHALRQRAAGGHGQRARGAGYRLELTPFGGIKDSGLGYKEGVQEAIKSFTNLKTYSAWLQQYLGEVHQQVVLFHLGFNLLLAVVFIGLTGVVAAGRALAAQPPAVPTADRPRHLDPVALATPSLAISCAAREALHQADVVETMLRGVLPVMRDNDLELAESLRARWTTPSTSCTRRSSST
jgi:hypothetical protein